MSAPELAARIVAEFAGMRFGIVRFWGFSVVRPNDQSYVLAGARADGERLDVDFHHEFLGGPTQSIQLWSPGGLAALDSPHDVGLVITDARRLRWADSEAWRDGDAYRIRTSRGEGGFDILDKPALTLAR